MRVITIELIILLLTKREGKVTEKKLKEILGYVKHYER